MSTSISHSRVDAWLSCRRKEFYGYHRKLTRVSQSEGLKMGSAGHHLLDVLYSTVLAAGTSLLKQRRAYPGAVAAVWDELDKMVKEGYTDPDNRAPLREVLENYLQREPFIDRSWSEDKRQYLIMAVEKEFNVLWDEEEGLSYPLVIDLIVKDPRGQLVVVDHKFLYDFYSYDATKLMPQIPKYIGALRALGYKVANEGIYNMLRTRPNSKGNKLTKDKLLLKLAENGFAWSDGGKSKKAAELEALADENGIKYFEGRPVEEWSFAMSMSISTARVLRTFNEQVAASIQIMELEKLPEEDRDLLALRVGNNMVCKGCPFKDLCDAELAGESTKILLATEYKVKEKRDVIEVSDDVE